MWIITAEGQSYVVQGTSRAKAGIGRKGVTLSWFEKNVARKYNKCIQVKLCFVSGHQCVHFVYDILFTCVIYNTCVLWFAYIWDLYNILSGIKPCESVHYIHCSTSSVNLTFKLVNWRSMIVRLYLVDIQCCGLHFEW